MILWVPKDYNLVAEVLYVVLDFILHPSIIKSWDKVYEDEEHLKFDMEIALKEDKGEPQ